MMNTRYYDLKEFVYKLNHEVCDGYRFYMETGNSKFEIEPVYNEYDEVDDFSIKDGDEEGFDVRFTFSLTEILCAIYTIEKVE